MTPGELLAIGVSSGTVSALINLGVTELRAHAKGKRNTEHQVLQVAEHLEAFAFTCAQYGFDNWKLLVEERPGALVSRPPDFPPFADTIEWQGLRASHASTARTLPGEVRSAILTTEAGFREGAAKGFRTAQFWTLQLGQKAFQTASYLREYAGLDPLAFDPPTWDYATFLRGELEKHEERKRQIAEAVRGSPLGSFHGGGSDGVV